MEFADSKDSNNSSLRDSQRESKQSKSSESNQNNESMTQKRINADSLQVRDSQKAQSLPNRLPRLDLVKSRNDDSLRDSLLNLPFHFHKHSPKDSQSLTFSPKITRFPEPKAFALKAKDDNLRLDSSSGGAFTLIAQYVLNRGGVVFGASFDENLNVAHTFIESSAELDKLRRSKYVESTIGESFKQVKAFLKQGRIVLFSGVQCQIHGLNTFLRKPYSNLLTIEVICNSVPSAKVWDIYKESFLEEYGEKLLSFNFRGKDFGWERGIFAAKTKTKTIPHYMSPFFQGFLEHTLTRKSCGNCYSKGFVSGADFTLGDFWGIHEYHADFVDDKGVSCVLVHNQKALDILDSLCESAHIISTTASIITLGNPAALRSNPLDKNRDFVLKRVFSLYERKGAKSAMDFLAQVVQNPQLRQQRGIAHHYYRVFKDDPLRKAISNALKRARKWLLNPKKKG